jgi:hypothetical protein
MAYSSPYNSFPPKKHDSFIQPTSLDSHASLRYSASSSYSNLMRSVPMENSSSRDNRYRYDDRYYDPRSYQHIPPPRSSTPPSSHHRTRSFRKRRSWPPPPSVEDEVVSLAKELRPAVLHDNGGEVVMRGTVDQDPIIIDVDNHESRFVLLREQSNHPAKQYQSDRSDGRKQPQEKEKVAPPALTVDVDEKNIFTRREPSPYAYTRTPKTPSNRSSMEYFMSPEAYTPPSTSFPKSIPLREALDPKIKQARQNTSSSTKVSTRSDLSDDSDLDAMQSAKLRTRRPEARASFASGSDSPKERRPEFKRYNSDYNGREDKHSIRTSSSRSNGANPQTQAIPRSVPIESWDYQDYRNESARTQQKPAPLQTGSRSDTTYSSRSSKNEYASPSSSTAESGWRQTPPSSPKVASRKRGDSSASSRPASPSASSVDLSQASYILSKSSNTQNDRSSTYPPYLKERTARPTSKLTSSMRQDSVDGLQAPRIDVHSPSPVRPPLPYPDDAPDVVMPSHEMFQIGLVPPFQSSNHPRTSSASSNASSTSSAPRSKPSQRPEIPHRHSMAESVPNARPEQIRGLSVSAVPTRKESRPSSPSVPISLPPCPRKEFSRKYDDWYTLEGNSQVDICPTCLDEIIRPTEFRTYFKRAPSRSNSVRTRCDFGSPWMRLAWLITLKRQRNDLDLIYALATVLDTEPECPGEGEAFGNWYGLQDQYGSIIPNFAICQRDRKFLEALFPSLIGVLIRLPSGPARIAHICSLRTDSRRFPFYLDYLVEIDHKTRAEGRSAIPNLKPLVNLIRLHAEKPECTRDKVVKGQTWHYMSSYPALTICEECYDDAVWPAVKQGSEIANKFCRKPMSLPPAFENLAASCQLYSPRMRRVWDRAMRYGDDEGFVYLTRKVLSRKELQSDCKRREVELKRLLERSSSSTDREWLRKELEEIKQEWLDWE